jgi:hypothetical protein
MSIADRANPRTEKTTMADAVGELTEGIKKPFTKGKGGTWHTVGWVAGIVLIVLLAWRFRAQLAGFLYGLPLVGRVFATIAGDAGGASQGAA